MPKRKENAGKRCPKCKSFDTVVRETNSGDDTVQRTRACQNPQCGYRFVTEEVTVGSKDTATLRNYTESQLKLLGLRLQELAG
jgi:transcriptional regulator NrdR family protein